MDRQAGDGVRFSLDGLVKGTYYLRVRGALRTGGVRATNPNYTLTLKTPVLTIGPDRYEPNNDRGHATDLGTGDTVTRVGVDARDG